MKKNRLCHIIARISTSDGYFFPPFPLRPLSNRIEWNPVKIRTKLSANNDMYTIVSYQKNYLNIGQCAFHPIPFSMPQGRTKRSLQGGAEILRRAKRAEKFFRPPPGPPPEKHTAGGQGGARENFNFHINFKLFLSFKDLF